MTTPLRSCLYDCEVVHERLSPKRHGFGYRLFFMDIDLDELPDLPRRLRLFSRNRFNFYGFRDRDHLDLGEADVKGNILSYFSDNGCPLPADARIRLVTLPSVFGYLFNPVCFYFACSADGRPLHAVVEVTNTFHELKPYLICQPNGEGVFELIVPKHFYVSPFSPLDTSFHFRLGLPGEGLRIHIDDLKDGTKTLASWIYGRRSALTDRRLLLNLVRFPMMSLGVILRIHWQALRLWLKRIPFHRKAADPQLQLDLQRPHSSLIKAVKP